MIRTKETLTPSCNPSFGTCTRHRGWQARLTRRGFIGSIVLPLGCPTPTIEDELNRGSAPCAGGRDMNDTAGEFERLLGHAALNYVLRKRDKLVRSAGSPVPAN
jgi:hypothetical protein